MFKIGTKLIRVKTGQKYIIESIDRMNRIGCLFKKDTWYNLKHINGPVDLIVREDEIRTAFRIIKQTNADCIRTMTDEELADFIPCPYDTAGEPEEIMPCIRETGDSDFVSEKDCRRCRLEWLQKEAK